MSRSLVIFCLVLTCSWYQTCMGNPFLSATVAYERVMSLINAVEEVQPAGLHDEYSQSAQNDIYHRLSQLSHDFQNFKNEIINKITIGLKDKFTMKADEFFSYVKDIEYKYEIFVKYLKYQHSKNPSKKYEAASIHGFANQSTSTSFDELPRAMGKLYESFINEDVNEDNLISIIARNRTNGNLMCLKQKSKQQLINNLHEIFVNSITKGLMVIMYSYEVKSKFEGSSYQSEREDEIDKFRNTVTNATDAVFKVLKMSSREIWRCDPGQHRQGITYDKLQEIFQAYFVFEGDTVNEFRQSYNIFHEVTHTCRDMVDDRWRCLNHLFCYKRRIGGICSGHLRDCDDMPQKFQVCYSPKGSDRRYEWLKTDERDVVAKYGTYKSNCTSTVDMDSTLWPGNYCMCNCESEERELGRYFSLKKAVSDVKNNKVVVGVKLARDNHVFHIKIKQATLGPNGTIIDEPKWKNTISGISKDQLLNETISTPHYFYSRPRGELVAEQDSVVFHENDLVYTVWYNHSSVFLDDLEAGPNRVVTGLKFKQHQNALKLQILTTEFDYRSGLLDDSSHAWESNDVDKSDREELMLIEPDDPTKYHGSTIDSSDNQFVDFRMSDLERDFGQYTVPFLDVQEVLTNPPMPLSGAGIYHKGHEYSGGFLGFKVMHYDYTNHL